MFVDREQFMNADVPQLEVETVIGKQLAPVPSIWSKLSDALPAIAATYSATQQQKMQNKMLELQMERARAGLPPLDLSQFQSPYAASFGVGLDNRSMLFIGLIGAALLGTLFLSRKGKR